MSYDDYCDLVRCLPIDLNGKRHASAWIVARGAMLGLSLDDAAVDAARVAAEQAEHVAAGRAVHWAMDALR